MKKKRSFGPVTISSLLILLFLTTLSCATATTTDPLGPRALEPIPRREGIVQGVFDNGLSYAVYQNAEPANRISLRLVVRAGSVLEEDDQRGVAHFVEHMAFNGTEHFKENELIRWAESVGMGFGPEVNAYTSYEETVYMLEIPADDPATLDTALLILADWAGRISFDPVELDKERGVVIEEWRQGRDVNGRMRDKQLPFLLGDSRFPQRLPIGDPEIIRSIDRQRVVDFYETWYRPELMSVIVVGDIESEKIVEGLAASVGALPAKDGPELPDYDIAHAQKAELLHISDPEFGYSFLQLLKPSTSVRSTTIGNFRRNIARDLITNAFNERLAALKEAGGGTYLDLAAGISKMPGELDYAWLGFIPQDSAFTEALQGILAELDRFVAEGLTDDELSRAIDILRARAESAVAESAKLPSGRIVADLQSEYLYGRVPFTPETALALGEEVLPSIDAAYLMKEIGLLFGDRMTLALLQSREPNDLLPSKDEIFSTWREWKSAAVETPSAKDQQGENRPLADASNEAPGNIVRERVLLAPDAGDASEPAAAGLPEKIIEWTLSNGMRVIAIPTRFKDDEVIMSATSWGGYSLVDDGDYYQLAVARSYRELSGLNGHSPTALSRLLAGKVANAGIWLTEDQEGLWGSSSTGDLETMVKLLNLQFTAPDFTASAWENLLASIKAESAAREANPKQVFNRLLSQTVYPDTPRVLYPSLEDIERLDAARSEELLRARYTNAADFTLFFAGSFDLEVLKDLVTTWFAGLPGSGEREEALGTYPAFPKGVQRKKLAQGEIEQSIVYLATGGSIPMAEGDEELITPFAGLLDMRLRNRIREDLGATYHVSVNGTINWYPAQSHIFEFSFGCEPGREEELIASVLEVAEGVIKDGPSESEIETLREQRRRSLETDRRTNRYWLDEVMNEYKFDRPLSRVANEERLLTPISVEKLQDFARRYLQLENRVEAILTGGETPVQE